VSVELRTPTADDATVIAAFLDEHGRSAIGESEIGEAEVRHWLTMPELWFQVAEREGRIVGYLDLVSAGDGYFAADVRALDREAADTLVAAAEARAGRGRIHGVAQGDDDLMRTVYEEAGYEPVRHSFEMRIELDGDVPEPEWPEGLAVRNFRPRDEERVHAAQQEAFADGWEFHPQTFEQWRAYTLDRHDFEPGLWWLVEDGDELAGFSLNCWHLSGDPRFGWVHQLGVRRPWRRRGLASSLLRQSFRDFRERGATRVGLGVDGESPTGAVGVYERAGMQIVRRNDTYEKRL
jgi:mycothiol synthase